MKIFVKIENKNNHRLFQRGKNHIRQFLEKKGYQEIDLPVLSPALIPESYLEVFETEFYFLNARQKLYLIPSPELFLKRLLVAGIGDCFYLGKSFRNSEPSSSLHSPEFEMLEIYKIGVDYLKLADEILEMLRSLNREIQNWRDKLSMVGHYEKTNCKINFDKWEKITVGQAFEKYGQISQKELFNQRLFLIKAREKGYRTEGFSYEEIWSQIYVSEVEPNLGKNGYPTLIYDYPKELAALAKLNPDKRTAQRFEFYINGVELGDCYTELGDWREQLTRFEQEIKKRKKMKKIDHPIDKGFIEALKYELPFCSGVAIGLERLMMVLLGLSSINDLKLIQIEI